MRSDKRKETQMESTDLYQNFSGKTTIYECITGVPYEITHTHRAKCNRAENSKSLNNGRQVDNGECPLNFISHSVARTG